MTSESASEGHPDKIADQIADAILDEILKKDPTARVACEVNVGMGYCIIGGEITTKTWVDVNNIARETIKKIGYDKPEYGFFWQNLAIFNAIHEQSPDIAQGVGKTGAKAQGAGDQGMCYGYATRETQELMPLPIVLAHKLTKRLAECRKKGILPYLRPDGKSQVTVEYDRKNPNFPIPKRVDSVIIAAQHSDKISIKKVKKDLLEKVIKHIIPKKLLDKKTKYFINNTGRFVIGGPVSDTGATGRKIIVDSYGGGIPVGGGSFSGKDPTKVDRSGAYMARYIAKNIVAAGLANRCQVRLSYAIGGIKPVELSVDTFGSGVIPDYILEKIVKKVFDTSPAGIIKELKLLRPIYAKTAVFGHFGRPELNLPWEKLDKVNAIKHNLD